MALAFRRAVFFFFVALFCLTAALFLWGSLNNVSLGAEKPVVSVTQLMLSALAISVFSALTASGFLYVGLFSRSSTVASLLLILFSPLGGLCVYCGSMYLTRFEASVAANILNSHCMERDKTCEEAVEKYRGHFGGFYFDDPLPLLSPQTTRVISSFK